MSVLFLLLFLSTDRLTDPTGLAALAPLLSSLVSSKKFTHLVAGHSAVGKDVFPRVSALCATSLSLLSVWYHWLTSARTQVSTRP